MIHRCVPKTKLPLEKGVVCTLFHGSPKDDLRELREGDGEVQNVAGVYLTPFLNEALKYTMVNGEKSLNRVYEVEVEFKNPAHRADLQRIWEVGLSGYQKRQLLMDAGFDGLIDEFMGEVVVFDKSQIKAVKKMIHQKTGE